MSLTLDDLASLGLRAHINEAVLRVGPREKITKEIAEQIRQHKGSIRSELQNAKRVPVGGPGTELAKLIPKFFASKTCSCNRYSRKMDGWGVNGCEQRFDSIVRYLCRKARRKMLVKHLGIINKLIAARWVRQSIDNAKLGDE